MIFLALGSNLGNREEYLALGCALLASFDVEVLDRSSICETAALLPPGAPAEWDMPYLNQVIRVETRLLPLDLLHCIKHIEQELGRNPKARWAPREIDIDIIAYGDLLMVDEALVLPHQQMDMRRFVLEPLAEIAPEWVHPGYGITARELLAALAP